MTIDKYFEQEGDGGNRFVIMNAGNRPKEGHHFKIIADNRGRPVRIHGRLGEVKSRVSYVPSVLPQNPGDFSRFCREFLHTDYSDPKGLSTIQLMDLVKALELGDVAIYVKPLNRKTGLNHYNLILSQEKGAQYEESLVVYDPAAGIRNIPMSDVLRQDNEGQQRRSRGPPYPLYLFSSEGHTYHTHSDPSMLGPKYWMPKDSLASLVGLGPIQTSSTQCGDMCIYAAALARGKIEAK